MPRFILIFAFLAVPAITARSAEEVSFRADIAPILLDNCLACHGPKKAEGGYRVDSHEQVLKPGDSGADPFAASSVDGSEAFRRMVSDDAFERMPLEGDPLPEEQIALFRKWIEQGAKFDGEDPSASLSAIVPAPTHSQAPEKYSHTIPVTALAFSPDGKQIYVGGYHEVTVWNVEDGSLARRISNVDQRTYSLVFSPDGKTVAVSGGSPGRRGEVRLFDAEKGELQSVKGGMADVVFDAAFSPQGDQIAVASADGIIRVFDVNSDKVERTITSHSDWVAAVSYSDDGDKLASASRDKTAKVFDVKTGELLATYNGHGQSVQGVAFHPNGNQIYSAAADRKIHLWKVADGKKAADVASFGGEVFKLKASDKHLYAGSADKTVRQFDLNSRKQVRSFSGHSDWAVSVAAHEASGLVASGGFDGVVKIWNADGKEVATFAAAPGLDKK